MTNFSAALPPYLVTLREGFEAALVVGIVMAYLEKAQQTRLYKWVYGGIGLGLVVSILVGLGFGELLQSLALSQRPYAGAIKAFLQAGIGTIAIALLSWMLIWMTQQAKSLKSEVEGSIVQALQKNDRAGWAVFGAIFVAVLQEGLETVLFVSSQFQSGFFAAILGALGGAISAAIIGFLFFKVEVKINLRFFFQVLGIFLLLIVGGLLISTLKDWDLGLSLFTQLNPDYISLCFTGGESCILGPQVWDGSQILPDQKFPGIILKAIIGYRQKLYFVQVAGYLIFLGTVGNLYFQSLGFKAAKSVKKEASV